MKSNVDHIIYITSLLVFAVTESCGGGVLTVKAVTPAKGALLLLSNRKIDNANSDEAVDNLITVDSLGVIRPISIHYTRTHLIAERTRLEIEYIKIVDEVCLNNLKHNKPLIDHSLNDLYKSKLYCALSNQKQIALKELCKSWVNMKMYYKVSPLPCNTDTIANSYGALLALNCSDKEEFYKKDIFEYSEWTRDFVWNYSRVLLLTMEREMAVESLLLPIEALSLAVAQGATRENVRERSMQQLQKMMEIAAQGSQS